MKINQLKAGSILSYLQMALGVVVGLICTPITLRLLGQSEYGLYNTVSSTISILVVLSLGFNSSYIRYYAKYKVNNDQESIFRLNGLFLTIFGVLGLIVFACGLFLSFNLELVFSHGLTTEEYRIAKTLMILLTINLSVYFPMSVFANIISAHEKYVFLKLLAMMKTVATPILTLVLLSMGYRSIAMVTVTLLISFITDVAYFIYVVFVLKNKFIFKTVEKGLFRDLLIFTSFLAINMIVDQVNGNMGKILLGRYNGTKVVAVYSIGYSLYQYYMMFSTSISGVFSPRIHKIINTTQECVDKQRMQLTELFTRVGRLQFLILALVATGIIFFGKPFIAIWAGEGYDNSYAVAVLLTLASSIHLMQNLGIEVQRALNKHKFRSIIYTIMAFINLLLSIFLCPIYGAIGAAIGTAASFVFANGLVMNMYYHKNCNIDILFFWKHIGKLSKGLIIPVLAGSIGNLFMDFGKPMHMILGIAVYAFIYFGSMWLFGMNQYEKNLLIQPIAKVLKRIQK